MTMFAITGDELEAYILRLSFVFTPASITVLAVGILYIFRSELWGFVKRWLPGKSSTITPEPTRNTFDALYSEVHGIIQDMRVLAVVEDHKVRDDINHGLDNAEDIFSCVKRLANGETDTEIDP